MNNFKESLPKSGHVNEVCKEWLVREDGALAYKLQSQEINDFYKGNRFRNAVVREDFPTALHEQIKEKENADKQAEAYRRRLMEQEEHDKRVANEISQKLERDLAEQQQKELQESELIAQQMQEIYVNLPPVPPPASREKNRPPPRPAKASTLQQQHHQQHAQNGNEMPLNGRFHFNQASNNQQLLHQQHQQHQQQHNFSNTDNYVGLALAQNIVNAPQTPTRLKLTPSAQTICNNNTNCSSSSSSSSCSSTSGNHVLKLSPEKYDQLVGNEAGLPNALATERHMQQHADDIELYVDPCDYASLKEIGLPMEEIKEMSKKLKQEQKDALLARRLQEMEANDNLTQEERDRMLAIEAQDKELAKMLQEREKAKIKRAKEKARQRKNQQKDGTNSTTLCSPTNVGLHCGPLLSLPQDCLSACNATPKHSSSYVPQHLVHPQTIATTDLEEDPLDMDAYSNPIDVIQNQRPQNGLLTNGSLTRDNAKVNRLHTSRSQNDDDIYTLPVDNCRNAGQRPTSLQVTTENLTMTHHNSMTRSENYALDSHDTLTGHDVTPRMNYNKPNTFDQSSSPTPPYMPIQGSRRLHTGDDRKKKSKDSKCTHQ